MRVQYLKEVQSKKIALNTYNITHMDWLINTLNSSGMTRMENAFIIQALFDMFLLPW